MLYRSTIWLAILMATLVTSQTFAQHSVVQTFDDLQLQPVDDLAHRGVTFDFKLNGVDSSDADFGSFGPVATEFVTDPSLVGNSAGILTLTFDRPTPTLRFGLALSNAGPISGALTIDLYDALGELITRDVYDAPASTTTLGFSELQYSHDGIPVSRAVLDLADAPGSFALDNLTYAVPEPGASLLFSCAALIACGCRFARARS